MSLTEEDKKLLEELGLSDIPEEDKQAVLDTVDDRMSKRFVANLLIGLPEDKRGELEKKVEEMNGEDPQKIIETLIDLHPDAKKVLEDSAKEIVEELKDKKPETRNPNDLPEVDTTLQVGEKNSNGQSPNNKAQPETKTEQPQPQTPTPSSVFNDYYRP